MLKEKHVNYFNSKITAGQKQNFDNLNCCCFAHKIFSILLLDYILTGFLLILMYILITLMHDISDFFESQFFPIFTKNELLACILVFIDLMFRKSRSSKQYIV
jgi:hypothetical protein